jgi:hypothetical protein
MCGILMSRNSFSLKCVDNYAHCQLWNLPSHLHRIFPKDKYDFMSIFCYCFHVGELIASGERGSTGYESCSFLSDCMLQFPTVLTFTI